MSIEQQVETGLALFKQILRSTGRLELKEARRLTDRLAFYIVVGTGTKQSDIVLSYEFLSDLPNTVEYQTSAQAYARWTAKRMSNPHPMDYYCKIGVPIRLEIHWPFEAVPQRAASFVHVSTHDLSKPSTVAICSVIMTQQQHMFDLHKNPLLREAAIVNTVRRAVDAKRLTFYSRAAHPVQLQELRLDVQIRPSTPEMMIDRFVAGKVYWMGFKQGDKRTKVWIADESDADYLGTDSRSLIQTAQVLEALKMIVLDSTQEYASAGDRLLSQAKSFEAGSALSMAAQDSLHGEVSTPQEWDIFICHAGEDKDGFVRPLAEGLRRSGLRVWYDEFTLKVGDSLRRAIDRGLQYSRFGVVVLSPPFFAKEWPQRELDGLVEKELGGRKVILPVWHNVTVEDVRGYSLTLADRVAAKSEEGMEVVVSKLLDAMDAGDRTERLAAEPALSAGEPRKPSDDIEEGIDLEELSVSITQGIAGLFMILVKNESDVDATIKKVVLKSKGIRLTDPVLPPSRDAWKIPAHGRLPIEWKATPDPTLKLQLIYDRMSSNPPEHIIPKAEIEFSFHCEVQGKLLKQSVQKLVYVDCNRRIWEL